MRVKDIEKQDAIIRATINLINKVGFASASVSKIAKEANVSPATLYIYYENKEDLLVSTYVDIKKRLSDALLKDFDPTLSVRNILLTMWKNAFEFTSRHNDSFQYMEQFGNSSYSSLVDRSTVEKFFEPLLGVLQRGIEEGVIKDTSCEILSVFMFYPVLLLSNPKTCEHFEITPKNIDMVFELAWDAIKR